MLDWKHIVNLTVSQDFFENSKSPALLLLYNIWPILTRSKSIDWLSADVDWAWILSNHINKYDDEIKCYLRSRQEGEELKMGKIHIQSQVLVVHHQTWRWFVGLQVWKEHLNRIFELETIVVLYWRLELLDLFRFWLIAQSIWREKCITMPQSKRQSR